jgi:predicted HAD superfamily phosphohydrolase YqeG
VADWTTTVRQVLPRFFAVARRMRPSFHLASLDNLSPDFLSAQGVTLLIWDVDGTLMPWHGTAVAPGLRAGWERLRAVPGLQHLILSNCGDERFVELGRVFPDVPVVKGYATPDGPAARQTLQGIETWTDGGAWNPLTDARVTTIRKPDAGLVRFALQLAGDVPTDAALMVGDQYFTDIAGANEAGVRTLKVRTWMRGSFPWPVAWMQRLETLIYRLFYGRVSERKGDSSPDLERVPRS